MHRGETIAADHADVLPKVLVPTVNGPRQLVGVEACLDMPVLLRWTEILSTKRTLEPSALASKVVAHALDVLVFLAPRLFTGSDLRFQVREEISLVAKFFTLS